MRCVKLGRSGRRKAPDACTDLRFEILESRRLLSATSITDGLASSAFQLDASDYDPDSILVKFGTDTAYHSDGFTNLLPASLAANAQVGRAYGLLPGLRRVELSGGWSIEDALAEFRSDSRVVYAEPNYRVRIAALPNDPRLDELWGLENTGQSGGTIDADIDASGAWDFAQNNETVVAVIDTGVDYNHEDLAANMWFNPGEIAGDGLDNDNNGFVNDVHGYDFVNHDGNPLDDQGHGTHVAGTIAAVIDNGVGVAGVATNARIMALKFLDATGYGSVADAVAAIDYAVANGAMISNNSWGGNEPFSQALYEAIRSAGDADHVFVAAAGNGDFFFAIGQNNDHIPLYPASFDLDNIIAVAATDHDDLRATFSNYGATTVDLGAPGVSILSTTPGDSYGSSSGTSMATPHVSGAVAALRSVQPTWDYQQVINQILATVDPIAALQGKSVTGGRLNAAAALGNPEQPGPEIRVLTDDQQVADNTGVVNFGATPPGFPLTQTFTVYNAGPLPLTLNEPIIVPSGFSLDSSFGATTLDFGESTTFAVRLDAATEGTFSGTLRFGNNDDDENPFNFNINGAVRVPPVVQIVDNGDPAFSTHGEWKTWNNQGHQGDVHESFPGTGFDNATWTFSGILPGMYRVSATWFEYSNRATDSPFTIFDDSTALTTTMVDQQQVPNDFSDAGADWEDIATLITINSTKLVVQLADDADGRVNADAIRVERIDQPGPEIGVLVGNVEVPDDSGSVDFGSTFLFQPVHQTFTVRNQGVTALTLDEPIDLPAGFSLAAPFGDTNLAPGETTTFAVRLDAAAVGNDSGTLSFDNNDPDENPYNFTITGSVLLPPAVQIVDNGDAGFQTEGEWTAWNNQGFQGDVHESLPGTGADVATWTFSNLLPQAYYRVAATWTPYSNRATNAPFLIYDDASLVGSVTVNQRLAADDFSDAGANWENLDGPYQVPSGTLVVRLDDSSDGRLIADAIRIERIDQPGPEIGVLDGNLDVPDDFGSVDFASTFLNQPVTRTFTVRNDGADMLTLDEPINLPTGFSLAASFGSTDLAPGETTNFAVRLDAAAVGNDSGTLSFGNDDPDENPYNFTIIGSVLLPPAVQIVDDGDAGFQTQGEWTAWNNQGFQGDVHESLPGTGADVATWTFSNLLPQAYYRVAATWTPYSNRATNAPFLIFDDAALLTSLDVNQKSAADDFNDAGANWENLGGPYQVPSGTLVVRLSDNADGRLIADAIRIERIDQPGPEIGVLVGNVEVPDDSGLIDFASTFLDQPVTRTFTVRNDGADLLTLDEAINLPTGFSLAASFGSTNLAPGETTTFAVRLDAAVAGNYSGTLSFGNDDPDENPYNFTIIGSVLLPPAVQIVDNGDAGFQTEGEWTAWNNQGFQGDVHESLPGTGADVATWTFTGLPAGQYGVASTWSPYKNRATAAPFTIYDDASLVGSMAVNQRVAADDFTDAGANWENLGGPYQILSGTLVVRVSDNANGRLIADAIRIERIELGAGATATEITAPIFAPSTWSLTSPLRQTTVAARSEAQMGLQRQDLRTVAAHQLIDLPIGPDLFQTGTSSAHSTKALKTWLDSPRVLPAHLVDEVLKDWQAETSLDS